MAIRRVEIPGKLIRTAKTVDPGPSGEFAVDFDGSDIGLFQTLVNMPTLADTKVGIFSCWVFYPSAQGNTQFIATFDASNAEQDTWDVHFDSNRRLVFEARDASLNTVINFITSTQYAQDVWHHILMAWNTANATVQIYVDDTLPTFALETVSDATIGYTRTGVEFTIADGQFITSDFGGCMSQFYLNTEETIDLSVAANRQKFISSAGEVVALGPDGSVPTGNVPIFYFDNNAANFRFNRGTGADMQLFQGNALANCDSNPPGGS